MNRYRVYWSGAPDSRWEEIDVDGEDHEEAAIAWAEELELGDLAEDARVIVEPLDTVALGWHVIVRRRQS